MANRDNLETDTRTTKRSTAPRIPVPADDLPAIGRSMVRSTDEISVVGVVAPANTPPAEGSAPAEKDFFEFATRLNMAQMVAVVMLSFLLTGSIILTILLVAGGL